MDNNFAEDVRKGLSSSPKYLLSKYFYNQKGDKLFKQIMALDEYYITNSEFEIFNSSKEGFLKLFNPQNRLGFQIIEFGAGDGQKTKVLLKHFLKEAAKFKYIPIDISGNALKSLVEDLKNNFPQLEVDGIQDDYFKALKKLNLEGNIRKVVLFLGSNIGNFPDGQAIDFLKKLSFNLSEEDLVMIGFDLKKDPSTILSAYDDKKGVTREFNLNLLKRINQELGGKFDLNTFKHFPSYDPVSGALKSYLISRIRQTVRVEALDQEFNFLPWEPIATELSQKFNMVDVENLAIKSGFRIKENYYDSHSYFVDSIWELAQ
ncbi:MAG: L-histidine N(alpha)-methyltransferase [Bacteroidetes bacterium]|nr:L-histidine N(alpha)-methyltransferase [Bacteroidota bacterium]